MAGFDGQRKLLTVGDIVLDIAGCGVSFRELVMMQVNKTNKPEVLDQIEPF